MNKPIIGILCILFIMTSCSNKINREGTDEYKLVEVENKKILLDENASQETNYLQFKDDKIILYNKPNHDICIYDIKSGREVEKIKLYKDGPNETNGIQAIYYDSQDSIWLYKNWTESLILIDNQGIIKLNRKLNRSNSLQKELYSTSPFPLPDLPLIKIDKQFILQGMNGPEVERGLLPATTIVFDIESDSLNIANPYPQIYGEGKQINEKWGTFSYRTVSYTLDPDQNILTSFPASDSIFRYSIKDKTYKKYFAGCTKETNIKPTKGTAANDYLRDYLKQYQYAGIFYDKYRKLYYRLVLMPLFDYDINDQKTHKKSLSVIILDSLFNKVGEQTLPQNTYIYRNAFVSKEGLHINILSNNDDYLEFVTLIPIKNEK